MPLYGVTVHSLTEYKKTQLSLNCSAHACDSAIKVNPQIKGLLSKKLIRNLEVFYVRVLRCQSAEIGSTCAALRRQCKARRIELRVGGCVGAFGGE